MATLHPNLRGLLEKTVIAARDAAEAAARAAIESLAVPEWDPFKHLTAEDRELRVWLRAKARQVGDALDAKTGRQSIDRLAHDVAYEHWHRMLFARFLAENGLLIHPDMNVPVTLQECGELAKEAGAVQGKVDRWTIAGRFASKMLPAIFRPDDPALQVRLAPEHQLALEGLLEGLPRDIFLADDSLGWVYQFWQSKRKDEVNKKGDKITGETLPAVTQLFTEHYMVLFLLHNTLGAWWAGKALARDTRTAADESLGESAVRNRVSPPGHGLEYLRLVHREGWTPAAGTFQGWPSRASELRILDPCCGSGHFLVAAFDLMVRLRMQEEGLDARSACDAVLRENLFGLEIDPRCTQIAAFALAFAAWRCPDAGGYHPLPPLNIACSGLCVGASREEWVALARKDTKLKEGMGRLYDLFEQAPELGSLIDPRKTTDGDVFSAGLDELRPLLERALAEEVGDAERHERSVVAHGLARSADLLSGRYHLLLTNVPYLGYGKQDGVLKRYCEHVHPEAKADLATCFLERCLLSCALGGSVAIVTPQNWLFLGTYTKLRTRLLGERVWNVVVRLGEHGFESPGAAGAFSALVVLTACGPDAAHVVAAFDLIEPSTPGAKATAMHVEPPVPLSQRAQLGNPDARVVFGAPVQGALLNQLADCYWGLGTGDFPRFGRCFWESGAIDPSWSPIQSTVESNCHHGGRALVLFWERGEGTLIRLADALRKIAGNSGIRPTRGSEAWNKRGVCVSLMRDLCVTRYDGHLFDGNCAALVPRDERHLPAIWAFCSSSDFAAQVRRLDQKLNTTNHTLLKVPFHLDYWQIVAQAQYPQGLPKPYSDDPTQWLFDGRPHGAMEPLQVALARLLGYRWPRQTGSSFPDCPALSPDALEEYADADGIVCIPVVGKEAPAAERLRGVIAVAYGNDWSNAKLEELLAGVGFTGKTLDEWLRDGFFEQHCAIFHQRPFIWHIWDGRRKDGFHALVNYHRLDRKLLEKLVYTYLGDWMERQQAAAKKGEEGAEARLAAAQELKERLEKILVGEAPYDIFVRWKPLDQQPIGWDPDLNDGVRMNIRPFMRADVLRKKPKIKWDKDRGKDPESAPWYSKFKGERINDYHLTLAEKRDARKHGGGATRRTGKK